MEAYTVKTPGSGRKFRLTDETMTMPSGTVLHRIEAVRDIPWHGVTAGDRGGWLEKESNLSQGSAAWVFDNAIVCGDARISNNAAVRDSAVVQGDALVYDCAVVSNHAEVAGVAQIFEDARVCGFARVSGHAHVCDSARVWGNASVSEAARIGGSARVCGSASVCGCAKVHGDATIYDNARVYGYATVTEYADVAGDAKVYGNAEVTGTAEIIGDAKIQRTYDYTTVKNFWSSYRTVTYTRSNGMWKAGCFLGTGKELVAKAYKDSELSGKCYEAMVRFVEESYATIDRNSDEEHGNGK